MRAGLFHHRLVILSLNGFAIKGYLWPDRLLPIFIKIDQPMKKINCITLILLVIKAVSYGQTKPAMSYEQYIRTGIPAKKEIDVFLNELSWAKFDPELGYILGKYIPHDGLANSSTISTIGANGARTSFMYANKPCRINTYGNSFTQCHQVSDGETWQEYVAAHLGEPIRNFGMGGYGVNQTYRRMLREENTKNSAEYILFYIWGDDHIRSLLRCRYMLIQSWSKEQDEREGIGKMFHGNFWPNIEMDLETGQFVEHASRITSPRGLYQMTNPDWMYENLKDDLALQMALYKKGIIDTIDPVKLQRLARCLHTSIDLDAPKDRPAAVGQLLDTYAFAATKYLLGKTKTFADQHHKKLMVILFDPYEVTKSLIKSGTRYDQGVVDYLKQNQFRYFDMNLVHVADYKNFNLSVEDYYKRYFIGHYNPTGNHFFAYSLLPHLVEWLSPKPITYQNTKQQLIDFKGYLDGY